MVGHRIVLLAAFGLAIFQPTWTENQEEVQMTIEDLEAENVFENRLFGKARKKRTAAPHWDDDDYDSMPMARIHATFAPYPRPRPRPPPSNTQYGYPISTRPYGGGPQYLRSNGRIGGSYYGPGPRPRPRPSPPPYSYPQSTRPYTGGPQYLRRYGRVGTGTFYGPGPRPLPRPSPPYSYPQSTRPYTGGPQYLRSRPYGGGPMWL